MSSWCAQIAIGLADCTFQLAVSDVQEIDGNLSERSCHPCIRHMLDRRRSLLLLCSFSKSTTNVVCCRRRTQGKVKYWQARLTECDVSMTLVNCPQIHIVLCTNHLCNIRATSQIEILPIYVKNPQDICFSRAGLNELPSSICLSTSLTTAQYYGVKQQDLPFSH